MAADFVRIPADGSDRYIPLEAAVVEEEPLLIAIRDAAKAHHHVHQQQLNTVPSRFLTDPILWTGFAVDYGLQRISNAAIAHSGSVAGVAADLAVYGMRGGPLERDYSSPSLAPHRYRRPRRADDVTFFLSDPVYNDGSAILIVPLLDWPSANGDPLIRGCGLFCAGTGFTIVLDFAIMGEQLFEVAAFISSLSNLFILWDEEDFDRIRFFCGLRFQKVLLIKGSLPQYPLEGTMEDLYIVLNSRNAMAALLTWHENHERRTTATNVALVVSATMLAEICMVLCHRAPRCLELGLQASHAKNSVMMRIGQDRWEFPFRPTFALVNVHEDVGPEEVQRRYRQAVAVVKEEVFRLPEHFLERNRQREPLQGYWYRRANLQTKFSGSPGSADLEETIISDLDVNHLTRAVVSPQYEEFIHLTAGWGISVEYQAFTKSGPVFVVPIISVLDEGQPSRGFLVFSPGLQTLTIVDYLRSQLPVYQMATLLEQLDNLKIMWSEPEAHKLRVNFGMKLNGFLLLRQGLIGASSATKPSVHSGSLLLNGKQAIEGMINAISGRLRHLDKDLATAVVRMVSLVACTNVLANECPEILRIAATASRVTNAAAIPAFRLPTLETALAATATIAGQNVANVHFPAGGGQQFYKAYIWRFFEANERAVPQETVMSASTLLKIGFLENIGSPASDGTWNHFVDTTELAVWRHEGRRNHLRKKLAQRQEPQHRVQCSACPLLPTQHTITCLGGNIVGSLRKSVQGFPPMGPYYEAANATTEDQMARVRQLVAAFYRMDVVVPECQGRATPGSYRVRFDYWHRTEATSRGEMDGMQPMTYREVMTIVTRFVQPLGQLFERNQPEMDAPLGTIWMLGRLMHGNCRAHCLRLPVELDVVFGVITFRIWDGPIEDEEKDFNGEM